MSEEKRKETMADTGRGIGAGIAGWIVPGLGHAILKRWGSAAVYFLSVSVLAILGMAMRGNVFPSSSTDVFDRLGFFADLGTGAIYFFSKTFEAAGPDVSHASGVYGTMLIATAGVLNMLFILEAFDIGRKAKT
ncbi:MAG: DUF6677 family protein [Candidatus Acidiferrales bacterium]